MAFEIPLGHDHSFREPFVSRRREGKSLQDWPALLFK